MDLGLQLAYIVCNGSGLKVLVYILYWIRNIRVVRMYFKIYEEVHFYSFYIMAHYLFAYLLI